MRRHVLVITGDHDFFPFAAEHIAQAIPNARLVTLKDCGHFSLREMSRAFTAADRSFLHRR
jgi:pimeloyl-ACP methyl ester carboxylesterase